MDLVKAGPAAASAIPSLRQELKSGDRDIREAAADALAQSSVYPKHLLRGIAVAGSETPLGLLKEIGFETEPLLAAEKWGRQELGTLMLGGGAGLN